MERIDNNLSRIEARLTEIKRNCPDIGRLSMSDLEGWSRVIDECNEKKDKNIQSKPEIKEKNCSKD